MKKNNLLLLLFAIPTFFIAMTSGNSFHTSNEMEFKTSHQLVPKAKPEKLFWFSVSVKIEDDSEQYKITKSGNVGSGNKYKFEKLLWKGLQKRTILVGPFETKNAAINSRMYYKNRKENINGIPVEQPPGTVYWFPITFRKSDRLKVYVFEKKIANIERGSTEFFINGLYAQLTFKQFAIGPFWDQEQATNAQSLYVKNQ